MLFEANDRPGGRTLNYDLGQAGVGDGYIELGGQFLDDRKYQPHAWALIKDELGFEVVRAAQPESQKLDTVLFTSQGPRPGSLESLGLFATLGPTLEELTRQRRLLPLHREHLDSMSFEEWLEMESITGDPKELMRSTAALGVANGEPSNLSALGAVEAFGGSDLVHAATSPMSHVVKGGLAAPTFVMADGLGAAMQLNSLVVAISQDEKGALVTVQQGNISTFDVRAQHVLFAGPPQTSLNMLWAPPLPPQKRQLFEHIHTGNCMKATLVYSRPFWQELNLSGQILNIADLDRSPFACLPSNPSENDFGVVACFVGGNFVNTFARWSQDDRRDNVASFVSKSFGDEALRPIHYIDHDWAAEPHIQGAFGGTWQPGVETRWGEFLNTDFGKVSWIGSDVVDQLHRGYVNAAIMTGREAAAKLIIELASSKASTFV